jgi:hypothetical protein
MTLSPEGYKWFAEALVCRTVSSTARSLAFREKIGALIRNERNRHRVPSDKGLEEIRRRQEEWDDKFRSLLPFPSMDEAVKDLTGEHAFGDLFFTGEINSASSVADASSIKCVPLSFSRN